jgi:hypothetical protein
MRVVGRGHGSGQSAQHRLRLRAFDRDHRHPAGGVVQRHIVGDDVLIDVNAQFLPRLRLGIDEKAVRQAEQVGIGLNFALRVEEEGVAPFARLEPLDMVRADGVQQSGAILARSQNFAAPGEIRPRGRIVQSLVAGGHRGSHQKIVRRYAESAIITSPEIAAPAIMRARRCAFRCTLNSITANTCSTSTSLIASTIR